MLSVVENSCGANFLEFDQLFHNVLKEDYKLFSI